MGQRLARRARIQLLRAVLRQDMGWFDAPENSSGEVMSRLSADVAALKGKKFCDQLTGLAGFNHARQKAGACSLCAAWATVLTLLHGDMLPAPPL